MRPQAAVYPDLHILAICPDLHILAICPDLLGATPSQYKNVFAACWSLHVGCSQLAGPYMCGVRSLRTHCMRPYM